jgi:hypothetical protein
MKNKIKLAMVVVLLLSLAVALPPMYAGASTKDHRVQLNWSWHINSPCTGERVDVSSTWNYLVKEKYDKNGVLYLLTHVSEQGSKGIGQTSGIQFNVSGPDQFHESFFLTQDDKFEYTERYTSILNFISPGNDYNFQVVLSFTFSGVLNLVTGTWEVWDLKPQIDRAECH